LIAHQRTSQSTLTQDIKIILKQQVEQTTKEALVNARVGQGKFRQQVLQLWDKRCCVTGAHTRDAIRASQIKPWTKSTNEERLDPYNGLPLTANVRYFVCKDVRLPKHPQSKRQRTSHTIESHDSCNKGVRLGNR
jgi:predicted restriction endonuclease